MSSIKSAGALELRPRPSRVLARWMAFVHGMALLAAVVALIHDPWWSPLPACVAASFWWTGRKYLRGPYPGEVRRLVWKGDSTWTVTDHQGRSWPGRLLPSSFIHPHLLVLRLSAPGRWRSFDVVLCRDSERGATLRALRRRLAVERPRPPSAHRSVA